MLIYPRRSFSFILDREIDYLYVFSRKEKIKKRKHKSNREIKRKEKNNQR
jgi:hypothetical protein